MATAGNGSISRALDSIAAGLAVITDLRDKPAGNIRITTSEHAATTILWPTLETLLPAYPDIHVELDIDSGLTDIGADRFDAGVRLGEQVAKDMVAVRIGPELRMAVVGAPSYFARRMPLLKPQDLTDHTCINLRMPTRGSQYAWCRFWRTDARRLTATTSTTPVAANPRPPSPSSSMPPVTAVEAKCQTSVVKSRQPKPAPPAIPPSTPCNRPKNRCTGPGNGCNFAWLLRTFPERKTARHG